MFFPEKGEHSEAALRLCSSCPAIAECREFAVADPQLVGIWGGTSERERKRRRQLS